MSDVIIYGVPPSSYVRTVRMTCEEKGITHSLTVQQSNTPEQLKVHPFGKMPAFQHGDVRLFETSAICRYIDEQFDGPDLTPKSVVDRALMEQWISALNAYGYPHLIRDYALQYIIPGFQGKEPNREAIDAGLDQMKRTLDLMNRALDGKEWAVGDSISLADLLLAPIVQMISNFPEGKDGLASRPNLSRVYGNTAKRASFDKVHAPS